MAIVSRKLHWTGSTGSVGMDSVEYTGVWIVETDDKNDQAKTVLDDFETFEVVRGSSYAYAGESGSDARADRIRANRMTGVEFAGTGRFFWEVVVNYTTPTARSGVDDSGTPTTNPLVFRTEISTRTNRRQWAADRAFFEGTIPGATDLERLIDIGEWTTPVNSCMVPFKDPIMIDQFTTTVTISKNLSSYNGDNDEEFMNKINSSSFDIDKFGYKKSVEKWTAKIQDIIVQLRRQNGVEFLDVTYVMEIDSQTWVTDVVDKGSCFRAHPGDEDGRGGTISQATIPAGLPKLRSAVDFEDRKVGDVLLDGSGKPLDTSSPPFIPVFIRYRGYREQDFLAIPFFQETGVFKSV